VNQVFVVIFFVSLSNRKLLVAWILPDNLETADISSIVDRIAFDFFLFASSLTMLILLFVFSNARERSLSSLLCQKGMMKTKKKKDENSACVFIYLLLLLFFMVMIRIIGILSLPMQWGWQSN